MTIILLVIKNLGASYEGILFFYYQIETRLKKIDIDSPIAIEDYKILHLDSTKYNQSKEEEYFSTLRDFGYDVFYTIVHEPMYGEGKSLLEE